MNIHTLGKNNIWLLPILSGILIGTSYIPFPPWASLFCFVPLWLFWSQQNSIRRVFLGGCITTFIFTLIGFNWVAYLLHEFAHVNWFLSVVGMLVYAGIAHLYVPLAGMLWYLGQKKLRCPESMSLMLMAMATVLCETYSLTLFDWNFGYTWFGSGIPIYHLAEIIGFSGLSAGTLLFNLPFYVIWKHRHQRFAKILTLASLAVFVLLNGVGQWLKSRLPEPDASFTTLLVQGNIGNEEKLAAELGRGFRDEIIKHYQNLTDQGLQANQGSDVDFIVWPEGAFPSLLGDDFKHLQYSRGLRAFVETRRIPLITGAFSAASDSQLITNSLFVLDSYGEIVPPHYSKSILLAFGEYIPGERFLPEIRRWLPPIGHFQPGPGPTVLLALNGYKIGPQICYESLFPDFTRQLANLGAQFIINVTNDSWYGKWQEPYQHMYMTLARGVEFRRPVVRATNTGISTVVLASGEILQRSPLHRSWTGLYKVDYVKHPAATFYQRWFLLVPALLWSTLALLVGLGIWRRGRSH